MLEERPGNTVVTSGMNARKAEYIRDLAAHFAGNRIPTRRFPRMTDEEITLKASCGKAPWALLYCPTCSQLGTMAHHRMWERRYSSWIVVLKCKTPECGTSWAACKLCSTTRKHLVKNRQLSRHNRKHQSRTS